MNTSGPLYTNRYQEFNNFRDKIKREKDILKFTQVIYQDEEKRAEAWNEDDGWQTYVVQSELNPENKVRMAAAQFVESKGGFKAGGNRVGVEYNENSGELYITFRGSQNYADWAHDLAFTKDGKKNDPRYGGHQATVGASEAFESLWNAGGTADEESPIAIPQEIGEFGNTSLKEILDSFHGVGVTHVNVSGHSLGGAMATLMLERTGEDGNNYLQEWMQEEGLTSSDMTAITYGAPQAFVKGTDTNEWHVPPIFHAYVNMGDPVPEIGRVAKSIKDNSPDHFVHYGSSEFGGSDHNLVYFGDSWVAAAYQATMNKDLMHFMSWYDINVSDAMVNEALGQYQKGVTHHGDPKNILDNTVEIMAEYALRVVAKPLVETGIQNIKQYAMDSPWMAEAMRARTIYNLGDSIQTTLQSLARGPMNIKTILRMEKLQRQVTKAFNQLTVFKTNIARLAGEFGAKAQELGMSALNQMKALMESARDLEGITEWIKTSMSGIETKLESSMRYWRGEAEAAEQGFGLSDVLFSETTPLEQVPIEIMNANTENALNADILSADAEISLNNPEVFNQIADPGDIENMLNEMQQRITERTSGTVRGEELDVGAEAKPSSTMYKDAEEINKMLDDAGAPAAKEPYAKGESMGADYDEIIDLHNEVLDESGIAELKGRPTWRGEEKPTFMSERGGKTAQQLAEENELLEIEESMARQSEATAQLARARTINERMKFTDELARTETIYGVPDLSLSELEGVLGMNEETKVGFEEALNTAGIEEGASALDVMTSDSFTWDIEEDYVAGEDLDVSGAGPAEGDGALGDVGQIQNDVGQELHGTDEINTETDEFEFGLDEGLSLEDQFASRPGWDHPQPTEATEGLTLEETIARNRSDWFIKEFESRGLTFEAAEAVVESGMAERLVGLGMTGSQATGLINATKAAAQRAGMNLKDFLGEAPGMAALLVVFACGEDIWSNDSEDPMDHLENIAKITGEMAISMAKQMAEGAIFIDDEGNFGSADAFENAAVFYGMVVGPKVLPLMMGPEWAAAAAGGPIFLIMMAIMGSILVYEDVKARNEMAAKQQESLLEFYNDTEASGNLDGLNMLCMSLFGSTINNLPDSMKDFRHLGGNVEFGSGGILTGGITVYDGPTMGDNWLMQVPARLYAQASVQANIQQFAMEHPDQKGVPWWLSPSISPSKQIPGSDPPEWTTVTDWSTNNIDEWCLIDTTGMGITKEDYIDMQFGIWNTIISPPGSGEDSQSNFFSGYGNMQDDGGYNQLVITGILGEDVQVANPTSQLDLQNNHLNAIKEEYLDWAMTDENSKYSSWQYIGSMAAAYRDERAAQAELNTHMGLFAEEDTSQTPAGEEEGEEEAEDDAAQVSRVMTEVEEEQTQEPLSVIMSGDGGDTTDSTQRHLSTTQTDADVGELEQGYDFIQWLSEDAGEGRQRYQTYDIHFSDQLNGGYDMVTGISDANPEGASLRESLFETAMSGAIATDFTNDVYTGMLKTVLDQMFYGQEGMSYDFGDDTSTYDIAERSTGLSDLARNILPADFQIFVRVLEMAGREIGQDAWDSANLNDLYMSIYLEGDNAIAGLDLPADVVGKLQSEVFDFNVDMWLENPQWNIGGWERENQGGFQYNIKTGMISHQTIISMVSTLENQGYGAAEDQLSTLEQAFHDARTQEGVDTFSAGSWLGTYMHQHPEAWADYDATSDNPSSAMQQAWEDSFTNVTITDAGANGTEDHGDYHDDPFTIQIGEITELDELQNWILNADGTWSHKPEDTPHPTRHIGGRAQEAVNEYHGPVPQTVARAATHAMQVWEREGFQKDPVKLLIDSVKRRRLNDPASSTVLLQNAL
jgi:hypothetical protein